MIRRFFFLFSWEARGERIANVSGLPFFPFARPPNFVLPRKKKPDRRLGENRSFVRRKRMLAGLIYSSFVMLPFFSPLLYHTCALMFSCVSFRALQTIASWRLGWDGFTKISEAKAHKIEDLV